MNFHITIDDKFINSFIEDCEEISPAESNKYFVRGDVNKPQHVTHAKATWVADIWSDEFRDLLNTITPRDKLIIHWYDVGIGKLMLTIKDEIKLHVAVWGGDFYGDPFPYETKWLFDSLTWRYVKKHQTHIKLARRPDYLIRQLWDLYKKKRNIKLTKRSSIKRIDTFLLYPNSSAEMTLIKKLYKLESIRHLPFLYNQNFDIANDLNRFEKTGHSPICLQVGNSATETNNHLDCFKVLEKFRSNNFLIKAPLSYGPNEYATYISQKGLESFGSKFLSIVEFMTREDYIKYLNGIDVCIMYHNRSQAFGNCVALLTLGKKLFLKPQNPLYKFFISSNLIVFDTNMIEKMSFEEFTTPLSPKEIEQNVTLVSQLFAKQKRLEYLKEILN